MSNLEEMTKTGFEIQDHNIAAGYVTYIIDIWKGDKNDPAVSINRYIGVWKDDQLEKEDGEAFDPDFAGCKDFSYRSYIEPRPMIWEQMETIKKADASVQNFRREMERAMTKRQRYDYRESKYVDVEEKSPFEIFMDAVDRVAVDEGDEEAWAIIEAHRARVAERHDGNVRL